MNRNLIGALIAIVALAVIIAVVALTMNHSDSGSSMPGMTMPGGSTMPTAGMTTTP